MAKKKKSAGTKIDPQGWMLTFSDLVTLMLTFFVMLLTMSSMDNKKFNDVFSVFTEKVGPLKFASRTQVQNTAKFMSSLKDAMPGHKLLAAQIMDQARALSNILNINRDEKQGWLKTLSKDVKVTVDNRGLVITMTDNLVFQKGTANLVERSKAVLKRLATFLAIIKRPTSIVGHTDNAPVKTDAYPSNWELSLARAVTVLQYILKTKGVRPDLFRVGARADTKPIADNTTPEGRAKNRRVEIIVDLRSRG